MKSHTQDIDVEEGDERIPYSATPNQKVHLAVSTEMNDHTYSYTEIHQSLINYRNQK